MTLIEANFFGDSGQQSLQQLLDVAYRHFKNFMSDRRIPCGQGPFTEKMVPRLNCEAVCLLWNKLVASGLLGNSMF